MNNTKVTVTSRVAPIKGIDFCNPTVLLSNRIESEVVGMNVALFCHSSGRPTEINTQQELCRQCRALENFAQSRGWSVEYCFFHTGEIDFEHPDTVLLHMLQYAHTGEFERILVEHNGLFPAIDPNQLPPIQVHFIRENQLLFIGKSHSPIFQEVPPVPHNARIYQESISDENPNFHLKTLE